jgi:hypothetical protein
MLKTYDVVRVLELLKIIGALTTEQAKDPNFLGQLRARAFASSLALSAALNEHTIPISK